MLAIPYGIRVAFEGLSWGRHINEYHQSWDVVQRADCPNLGIGIDSYHIFAAKTPLDEIDYIDPSKIFLVQLNGNPREDDWHRWYPADALPHVTVDHHEEHIIPLAVMKLAAKLGRHVRARIEFIR